MDIYFRYAYVSDDGENREINMGNQNMCSTFYTYAYDTPEHMFCCLIGEV